MTTDRPTLLPSAHDEPAVPRPGPVPGQERAQRRRWTTAAAAAGSALAVTAVVAALALGGGSTQTLEQRPSPQHPVAPAVTSPAASPVVVDAAPGTPDAQPPTPGPDLVVDGVDTARIVGFADRDGQLVVTTNRIRLLTGDEADAYATARGEEAPVPNDQLLVDDSPRLRDYPVRPDAPVTLTIPLTEDPQGAPTTTTLPALRELLAGRADGAVHPFELVVEDGVVVAFRMLYQP